MNTPFTPQDPAGGFGFGPQRGFSPGGPGDRLHERRRHGHGRRERHAELVEQVRAQRGGPFGPGGPGFGFGPGPFGAGGGGRRGRGGRRGPGGRGRRGDVRAAILTLLAERQMHGYEMIQEIAERSDNLWKPSPGSVYPTLQMLEDEGLIAAAQTDGSKKLFELTDEGRAAAEKIETAPWTEITEGADPAQVNLREAVGRLFGAVAQSAHAANADQQQRILDIVNNARREIYQILGES